MSLRTLVLVPLGVILLGVGVVGLVTPATAQDRATSTTGTGSASQSASKPAVQRISLGQAAILGIVEGLTEYLPVSSTGHMILTSEWMGMSALSDEVGPFGRKLDKEKMASVDAFEIVIQFGAILAVAGLYRKRVGQMFRGLAGKDPAGLKLVVLLLLAFLPAAVIGLTFHKKIEEYLFAPVPVVIALAVGGVLMIAVEQLFYAPRRKRHCPPDCNRPAEQCRGEKPMTTSIDKVTYLQALCIGFAQCLAMWPGTSRSMITIIAGLVVGLDMLAAAEFSFLLALPTLGAACMYSGYKDHKALMESTGPLGLVVGLAVSAMVAAIAVKAFVKWLTKHGLAPFGVYRILLAAVLAWMMLRG